MILIYIYIYIYIYFLSELDQALVGISLTYILLFNGTLQLFIQRTDQLDNIMTSIQPAFQYVDLTPELDEGTDKDLRESWPEYGLLTLESASFSHHASLPFVLRKIFVAVRPYEKVMLRCSKLDINFLSLFNFFL